MDPDPASAPGEGPAASWEAPSPADHDPFGWGVIADVIGFALRAPGRHRLLATAAFLAVLGAAGLALATIPFRYQVQAQVLAQRHPLMGNLSNPGMNRDWDAPTRAAREAVIRREHLVGICQQTNFVERYLRSRAPAVRAKDWLVLQLTGKERSRDDLLDSLVDTLAGRLWVNAAAEGTVTITFEWSDRQLAYDVVEAALQTFLEDRHASEIKAVGETIAILEGHDARIQREIATTVQQVEEKERALRIRSAPRRAAAVRARDVRDEEAARLGSVLESRRRALSDLEDFRQQRLAELQTQLAQQEAVYASNHPALAGTRQAIESLSQPSPQTTALRAEIQQLEAEIARRGGRETNARAGAATLEAELSDARQRLMESEDPRLELERRRLEDLLQQHSNLLQRVDAARVEMDTAQAAFKYRYTVIAPPQLPKKPIKPYGLIFLVGGLLAGVGAAIATATAADLMGGRVVERWQVERALDLPVVGELRRR